MKPVLYLFLMCLVFGVLQCVGCSNNTSTQSPVSKNPSKDSTNLDSLKNIYFSVMSVQVQWGTTAYPPELQITIDSDTKPLSILPGDSLWYTGANGRQMSIPRYDTTWTSLLANEIVESGNYVFTFQRLHAADTLRASFSLPVPPFHITAPGNGATVRRYNHTNDTIFYSPGGGQDVAISFRSNNTGNIIVSNNKESDDGKYVILEDGDSDCEATLIRHFIGSLSSPGPFHAVNFDYYASSSELHLHF